MNDAPAFQIAVYSDRITHRYMGNTTVLPTGGYIASGRFGSQVLAVQSAVISGAEAAASMIELQHPEPQVRAYYNKNHVPDVSAAARTLHRELLSADKANREILENAIKPKMPISDGRLAVTISLLSAKKPNDIIQLMMRDRNIAAIAFEHYDLLNLPEAAKPQLMRSVAEVNIARNFEGTTASQPTLQDMLGEDAVIKENAHKLAVAEMKKLDDQKSEIDTTAAWLRHVIDHTGTLAGIGSEAVWQSMQRGA